ncbi:prolipoprotein diacylglyceryl transferase [Pendulispora albinea]|uniref:Phosphatidylglycerol--prolipoprotein diacylglyceryl transferase n=1 Tax=Pendulispora albinea TaxID=2741071 RepID=A0ABZ2M1G4_9BACT
MHPILFRIPLPHGPLKLWWGLVAVAVLSAVYAIVAHRRKERDGLVIGGLFAVVAAGASYFFRGVQFDASNLPIYSYGVMLGLSLVVGWYLTLTLAERDGLPKETMANCYVFTALAALVGSRLLYVATNMDEFKTFSDIFALRRGGLVAYGGFIGGYLGSWAYLARHKIRLMPWADVAVPSLASGLFITRIGCYLFGCDFGKRLSGDAPGWLKKLGTFPHWAQGTLDGGDGSPAYLRHLELFKGTPLGAEVTSANASLPVHPTQIYESLVGLLLLGLLLWQRKQQRFRGQIFFTFVFAYGFCRFLLEILRDDVERGEYGPAMGEHLLVPGALLVLSIGFVFGIALGIKNAQARLVARVLAFLPPIIAYIKLRPASFGGQVNVQLSTSQLIAVITGLLVSYFYARYWQDARRNPKLAMAVGTFEEVAPRKRKKARAPVVQEVEEETEEPEEERDEDEERDEGDVRVSALPDALPSGGDKDEDVKEVKEVTPTAAASPTSKRKREEKAEAKDTEQPGKTKTEKSEKIEEGLAHAGGSSGDPAPET